MLPRIYSFLGRWLHFRANFLRKGEFFTLNGGFWCGNGEICCGEIEEGLRREIDFFLETHSAGRTTKKKTTRCPKTSVIFSLVIRKLSFLFELCVFFFVLCIRCYPKLFLKFRIIFEEPFRDLHRIEGSSLFDLVAHQPEGETIGVGQVFADATHKHVIATFEQEGHRIFAH